MASTARAAAQKPGFHDRALQSSLGMWPHVVQEASRCQRRTAVGLLADHAVGLQPRGVDALLQPVHLQALSPAFDAACILHALHKLPQALLQAGKELRRLGDLCVWPPVGVHVRTVCVLEVQLAWQLASGAAAGSALLACRGTADAQDLLNILQGGQWCA